MSCPVQKKGTFDLWSLLSNRTFSDEGAVLYLHCPTW